MKNKLHEVRTMKHISLSALSEMSGIAKSHINSIENDKANPSVEVVCKLANALDVKGCEIFNCDAYRHQSL